MKQPNFKLIVGQTGDGKYNHIFQNLLSHGNLINEDGIDEILVDFGDYRSGSYQGSVAKIKDANRKQEILLVDVVTKDDARAVNSIINFFKGNRPQFIFVSNKDTESVIEELKKQLQKFTTDYSVEEFAI